MADAGKKFSLLDMVSMENRLADILDMPVDLAPAKSLKDGVRERRFARPSLPFKDFDRSLRDIVDAVETIEQVTAGMDFEAFREDPKRVAAVERKLCRS